MNGYQYIVIVLIGFVCLNCQKEMPDVSAFLSETTESDHFIYHFSSFDKDTIDIQWQEKYYEWLLDQFALDPTFKIDYFKYRDKEQLEEFTGRTGNAFAQTSLRRIHTIWYRDNHECVHVLCNEFWGVGPALFDEGVAVAHQATLIDSSFVPGWNGKDFHELCQQFHQNEELPALDDLIESKSFRNFEGNLTYPVSGSFVAYLLDEYGYSKLKTFFASSKYKQSTGKSFREFEQVYKIGLQQCWDQWLHFLEEYNPR